MLSNKEIVCPNSLLDLAHKKKGVKVAVVNAGKPLPMLSVQDAVNENLIEPIFIGHEVEIQKCAEDIKWDISKFELIHELMNKFKFCLLYTSPSPRDMRRSRMPSSA